eukprot:1185506-Prorocentrum_minimum.AAC.6
MPGNLSYLVASVNIWDSRSLFTFATSTTTTKHPRRFLPAEPTPTRGRKEAAQGGIYPLTSHTRLQRVEIEGFRTGFAVHGQSDDLSWKSGPHQPC